jgi:hypothetical protein
MLEYSAEYLSGNQVICLLKKSGHRLKNTIPQKRERMESKVVRCFKSEPMMP